VGIDDSIYDIAENEYSIMTASLASVVGYALIPATAVLLGGIAAIVRAPGARLRSAVQHFAAGLVFAAIGVELLPDIVHEAQPVAVVGGFAIGLAVMLAIRSWSERSGEKGVSGAKQPSGLLATLGVDLLVDGLLVGVGFAAGAKEGLLLTVALATEGLFLGLAGSVAQSKAGVSRTRIVLVTAGLASLLLIGATVGAALLGGLSGAPRELVLSFGASALLYLVTEELLVEAHEEPETAALTGAFFVGFVLLLIVEMIATGRPLAQAK
jgi:zinc transporter, ZIP family